MFVIHEQLAVCTTEYKNLYGLPSAGIIQCNSRVTMGELTAKIKQWAEFEVAGARGQCKLETVKKMDSDGNPMPIVVPSSLTIQEWIISKATGNDIVLDCFAGAKMNQPASIYLSNMDKFVLRLHVSTDSWTPSRNVLVRSLEDSSVSGRLLAHHVAKRLSEPSPQSDPTESNFLYVCCATRSQPGTSGA